MATALLRGGLSKRVAGAGLARLAPAATPAAPLLRRTQPAPTVGGLLRPFLLPRASFSSENEGKILVDKAEVYKMKKALRWKNLESLRFASDMRRVSLRADWAGLSIVNKGGTAVNFSSLRSTKKAIKNALEPGLPDFQFIAPVVGFLFSLLLLTNNYDFKEQKQLTQAAEELLTGDFTRHLPPKD